MGSRTGSSMRSLVGRKRGGKLNATGGAMASEIENASETLTSKGGTTISAGSGGVISGVGGTIATAAACAAFATSIKVAAGTIGSSKPSLEIVYHTSKYADSIFRNLPDLYESYKVHQKETIIYHKLAGSPVVFPAKVVENMVIDEVADFAWSNIKSGMEADNKMCIHTTPHQDRLAKFIISQAINLALNMLKKKIKGEKIDKHFYYKQAIGAALEYYLDGVMQSSGDAKINPNQAYNDLNPLLKKVMHTSVKETAKDLADMIYDDIKENVEFPGKRKFKNIVKKKIEEKYNISLEPTEYDEEEEARQRNIVVTDQERLSETPARSDVVLSTKPTVNGKQIDTDNKIRFYTKNEKVQAALKPVHYDLLNVAATLSKLEYLFRTDEHQHIYPKDTALKTHTVISAETSAMINQLGTFLLGFNPHIKFEKSEREENEVKAVEEEVHAVVLFSGGLDSIAGMEYARQKYKKVKYVFVNNGVPRISGFVRKLQKSLGLNDDLIIFQTQRGGNFLQQTRGFSFLTAGLVVADIYNAKHLIVSECGVTKYQPSINMADEITKTTHPLMISLAKEIYGKLSIMKDINFPFDKSTKAEIIATVKDSDILRNSRSCRTSNISDESKHECGHCFGCLLKHISLAYVSGKSQDQFLLDPITNKNSDTAMNLGNEWKLTSKRYESILSLVSFCETILADKECLLESTRMLMKQQKTEGLFQRHAQDMIYGLMYMKQKGWVNNEIILAKLEKIETSEWFNIKNITERRKEIVNNPPINGRAS